MGTVANSEDRDELPHNATFHQGLHCFLRENRSLEKLFFLIIAVDPTKYAIDHLYLIVQV